MALLPLARDLFTALLVLLMPLAAMHAARRLQYYTSTRARIARYQRIIWRHWTLTVSALLLAYPAKLYLLPAQQSSARWFDAHPYTFLIAAAATTGCSLLVLGQGALALLNTAWRQKIAKALRTSGFAVAMLPVSTKERRYWILLCLSAGVCEELLYRGFLMHFFCGGFAGGVSLGLVGAWLASSVLFGLAHAYQGAAGVIQSLIAGLLLGLIAILSGQLTIPIFLHALFDLRVLWMYRPLKDDPATAEKLAQGCAPSEV